jgi:hypothetical protein
VGVPHDFFREGQIGLSGVRLGIAAERSVHYFCNYFAKLSPSFCSSWAEFSFNFNLSPPTQPTTQPVKE